MSDKHAIDARGVVLIAAVLILITMGARQSTGLFLLPIVASTGLSIAAVSFAMAVATVCGVKRRSEVVRSTESGRGPSR